MTPKEKAEQLYNKYYMLLIQQGEGFGQEILVSLLAKKSALIAVDYMIETSNEAMLFKQIKREYLQKLKNEIQKL